MKKIIEGLDFLIPLVIGIIFAGQFYEKKAYDEVFIIAFIALTFAGTRFKFMNGSEEYRKECEDVIQKRREESGKIRWYEGFGVSWGNTIAGSTLISVIIFGLSYLLFKKFSANDFLTSFLISGFLFFFLKVMRYLARHFFLDVLCGVIVVSFFVFFSLVI